MSARDDRRDRLLTARQVAETLGVTPKTVLRWTSTRGLPGFRLGRALRYREADLEAWLRRHATTGDAPEEESPTSDAARHGRLLQAQLPNESPTALPNLRSAQPEEEP
jgi:excisionase family DNA binding protein